ncbi:hypothetical protein GCM10027059_50460 [Myceligenerans halotolerans]
MTTGLSNAWVESAQQLRDEADEPLEVPRAGVAPTRVLRRRQRWYRAVIVCALCLFPLVGLALFVTSANLRDVLGRNDQQTAAPVQEGRTAAVMAVEDWLNADSAPVPGGQVVAWESAEELPRRDPEAAADRDPVLADARLIVHRVVVRSDVGVLVAVVLVASWPDGSQAVVGRLGLEPAAASSRNLAASDAWTGVEPVEPGDSADAAIAAWVDAFTSGDPDRLRLVVGDPASEHYYLPMRGVASATHDVHAAAAPSENGDGEPLLVQVDLTLAWAAQEEPAAGDSETDDSGTDESGPRALVSYDVLIADPDSASPRVVAWGAPGAGRNLRPYQNAITHDPPDEANTPHGGGT